MMMGIVGGVAAAVVLIAAVIYIRKRRSSDDSSSGSSGSSNSGGQAGNTQEGEDAATGAEGSVPMAVPEQLLLAGVEDFSNVRTGYLQLLDVDASAPPQEEDESSAPVLLVSAIPILGRVDNPLMSSVVIMNGADSAVHSPTWRKREADGEDESALPFPALSRKFEVNLVSRWHVGLLVSTGFAAWVLPLLEAELKMQSYQVDAASVLVLLPWSYSFIWGFISDAVPILESRRKAYIILAWMTTMLACFAMALVDQFISYRADENDVTTADILRHSDGLMDLYMVFLMMANFGCIVALVIGQTYFSGEFMGQVIADYAIFDVTDLGATPKVTLQSDPPPINAARDRYNRATIENLDTSASELQRAYMTASNFYQRLKLALRGHWIRLRSALGKESTSRVIRFLIGLSSCGVNGPHNDGVFSVLSPILWKYFFLNCDWRWCVFSSFIIITMTPQFVYYTMATLNPGARNIDIYAVVSALTGFIRSAIVILELAITAEIAPVGGEGAFVGIVVSMASSMRLMANTVSNAIGFLFKDLTGRPDRMQVAFALVLSHIIQVLGLVALVFLPKQKRQLQRLHRFGNKDDKCTTWWIIGCLAVSFIVSTVFNALAIAPTTSCMGIVGGSGC
ncbi:Folate-biopterin transporter [Phytophthora cactorum]|nr:Folate-biopterin transporter [Phytophthora cactorum]